MTILYSAGCRFCRWVARTIVPSTIDVIPTRSPEGQAILDSREVPEDKRYVNWWYQGAFGLWRSDDWGLEMLLHDLWGWKLKRRPILRWVNNRIKDLRPILAKFVPQGRAIIRRKGVTCTTESF